MDFGLDSLRDLIEDFLSDSGGRRGREREQRRQQRPDEPAGDATADAQARDETASATAETTADAGAAEDDSGGSGGGGGLFGRGSESADEDDLDDLYYRLEELEEKESTLGTVRDSQQQVADQVEEMNDTVRQLLGVYDMLTDDVNPFTGEGEERKGFGVFGEDEPAADGGRQAGLGLEESGQQSSEETVSFDDLKGVIEDAAAAQSGGSGGERITFDEDDVGEPDDGDDDTRVEVQATESVDGPSASNGGGGSGDANDGDDGSDVTLETLADTYATDIIVFEWLTELVRTARPAATLRAISYYAEIGWIDEEVREQLEAVLSGLDLDIHVDPGATPDELTAEDHADSYTYIMKLQEIHETKREVEPDVESGA
ncbi:FlaD/FlaE family flagellar protein [Natrinema sp. 1APR25-10V2]|uniref:FlaD/FlaE family flagellar protein n=1 Tax=Natrinema sp. 1APR25-10V2 TaxID=2951081 RepID=UPI00287564A0|nr:FlaD/FlaE family flagellar protein [Natrinema sp. 1APR25-10V2]MDS0476483.1 flagella accessory C family protein [Natrinema sp. 1APR25-10V2]